MSQKSSKQMKHSQRSFQSPAHVLLPTQAQCTVNNGTRTSKSLLLENEISRKRVDEITNDELENGIDSRDFGTKIVIIKKPRLKRPNIVITGCPVNHFCKESDVRRMPNNDKKSQLPEVLKEAQKSLTEKCKLSAFLEQIDHCVEQEKQLQARQKELLKFCEQIISPLSAKAKMSTLLIETQKNSNDQPITALDRVSIVLNDKIRSNIQRTEVDIENLDESKKLVIPWSEEHKERIVQLCKMQATQEAKRSNRHNKC